MITPMLLRREEAEAVNLDRRKRGKRRRRRKKRKKPVIILPHVSLQSERLVVDYFRSCGATKERFNSKQMCFNWPASTDKRRHGKTGLFSLYEMEIE